MKTWITVIGLIIFILGLGMFVGGFMGAESYGGQWATEQNLENYSFYNAICSAGLIIGIIGFIILMVGLASKEDKQPKYQPQYPQQQYGYQQPYQQLPQAQPAHQQPTQQPQIRYCASCEKQIPFDSNLCPYCGYKKSKVIRDRNQQPTQPQSQLKYCDKCNKYVENSFTFCPYCSQPLIFGGSEIAQRTYDKIE